MMESLPSKPSEINRLFTLFFQISSKLGVAEYKFDPSTNRLIQAPLGLTYVFYLFSGIYFFFYIGMELYFLFNSIMQGRESMIIIIQTGWIFGPLCGGIPFIHQWLMSDGVKEVISEFMGLQAELLEPDSKARKSWLFKLRIFGAVCVNGWTGSSFGIFLFFCAMPNFPVHIYTLFMDPVVGVDRYSLTFLLCGLYEFLVMFIIWGKVFFTALVYLGIHTCMSAGLKFITVHHNSRDAFLFKRKRWEICYKRYISIQLFYRKYNEVYSGVLSLTILNAMAVFWTNFYSLVMLSKQSSPFLSMFLVISCTSAIVIFLLTKIPGNVFAQSQEFIDSWRKVLGELELPEKTRLRVKYRQQLLNSCQRISPRYGDFITMKPLTSLFLFFFATNNLIVFFTI